MNILIIGSGGREHALAHGLSRSMSENNYYAAPGNPGIFTICQAATCDPSSAVSVLQFCIKKAITLVVIGPENYLVAGLADTLRANGIRVFGPGADAARLESSKSHAREFMERYGIPSTPFKSFTADQEKEALIYLSTRQMPVVVKADGLAAGKGVVVAHTLVEASTAIKEMFSGSLGTSGSRIVIEDFLEGFETSVFVITDGTRYLILPTAQDYKRIGEGGTGKNTGGMGAVSPVRRVAAGTLHLIEKEIVEPTLAGLRQDGNPFIGCLYCGLMIKDGRPHVVEYNVRFGDPETQAVIPLLVGDFAGLLLSAAEGKLNPSLIGVRNAHSCTVVLASSGYPDKFETGFTISGIDKAERSGAVVFHAGTKVSGDQLVTAGGRVVAVTALGIDAEDAQKRAYAAASGIEFMGKTFRKDIGADDWH